MSNEEKSKNEQKTNKGANYGSPHCYVPFRLAVEVGEVRWTRGIDRMGRPYGDNRGHGTDEEHRQIAEVLVHGLAQISARLGINDPNEMSRFLSANLGTSSVPTSP